MTVAPLSLQRTAKAPRAYNNEMLFVQALAIISVVMCHGGKQVPSLFASLMPFYSWHMQLFMFVSGYFFSYNRPFWTLVKHKTRTLLIPALVINLFYGLFCQMLQTKGIISYSQPVNLYTLFVQPFENNLQFGLNISMWFIFQLYVIEILIGAAWRFQGKRCANILLMISTLLCLLVSFIRFKPGYVPSSYGFDLFLCRTAFLMFFFVLGRYYRDYWEGFVTKHAVVLLVVSLGIQIAVQCFFNFRLTFSTLRMNAPNVPIFISPILTSLNVTLILLCLSKLIHPPEGLIRFIGANTKAVVYHHQLCFFLLTSAFAILNRFNLLNGAMAFPREKIQYDFWFVYPVNGSGLSQIVYVLIGLIVPIVVSKWIAGFDSRWTRWLIWLLLAIAIYIPFWLLF